MFDLTRFPLFISRPTELMETRVVQYRRFNHATLVNTDLWCLPLRTGNLTQRVGETAFNLWRRSLSRLSLPSTSTRLYCEEFLYVQGMWAVDSARPVGILVEVSLRYSTSRVFHPKWLSALTSLETFDLDF
jgi:hypothetical protein